MGEASMEHDSDCFLLVNDNKAYLAFRSHQIEEFNIRVRRELQQYVAFNSDEAFIASRPNA